MSAGVNRLLIRRFRSFPSDAIEFGNPTILVGRNGSGKSNLADAFSFLSEAMFSPLRAVLDRRGGIPAVRNRSSGQSHPPNLGLGIDFHCLNGRAGLRGRFAFELRATPNYGFAVVREQCVVSPPEGPRHWYDRTKQFRTNAEGVKPSLDPTSLCLPVVGGDERFSPVVRALAGMRVYSIQPDKVRQLQDPDSGSTLRPDGSNAASVLQELSRRSPETVQRVYEILAAVVPNTTAVRSTKHGNKLSLEFTQKWGANKTLRFQAFNMSDGTLRVLGLLMAVFQRPPPTVLIIEEPEATIHPGALGAVLDLLRHAAERMQVVVTTHSPELLDAKWIEDRHLRIVTWEEGASHVLPVSDATRDALREHLMGAGELMRSNALEPRPLFMPEPGSIGLFGDLP